MPERSRSGASVDSDLSEIGGGVGHPRAAALLPETDHCPLLGTARSAGQQIQAGRLGAIVGLECREVTILRIARFLCEVDTFSKSPVLNNPNS